MLVTPGLAGREKRADLQGRAVWVEQPWEGPRVRSPGAPRDVDRSGVAAATREPGVGTGSLVGAPGELFRRAFRLLRKLRITAEMSLQNHLSRESCTGDAPVVVSLTSYGRRIRSVHLAIESIARGASKPTRLILWLDESEISGRLPSALRRLQRRGLEVHLCENYGPHKKYFPYVRSIEQHALPLVTADDDVAYPRNWLSRLVEVARVDPVPIVCHRAKRMSLNSARDGLEDYARWELVDDDQPSFTVFSTGTSGALYPPVVLNELRRRGDVFLRDFWHVDDVWLNSTAVAIGVPTRQVNVEAEHFPMLLGSQRQALFRKNHAAGGNDRAISIAYTPDHLELISGSRADRGGPP